MLHLLLVLSCLLIGGSDAISIQGKPQQDELRVEQAEAGGVVIFFQPDSGPMVAAPRPGRSWEAKDRFSGHVPAPDPEDATPPRTTGLRQTVPVPDSPKGRRIKVCSYWARPPPLS